MVSINLALIVIELCLPVVEILDSDNRTPFISPFRWFEGAAIA
jgi:hypothetical protein